MKRSLVLQIVAAMLSLSLALVYLRQPARKLEARALTQLFYRPLVREAGISRTVALGAAADRKRYTPWEHQLARAVLPRVPELDGRMLWCGVADGKIMPWFRRMKEARSDEAGYTWTQHIHLGWADARTVEAPQTEIPFIALQQQGWKMQIEYAGEGSAKAQATPQGNLRIELPQADRTVTLRVSPPPHTFTRMLGDRVSIGIDGEGFTERGRAKLYWQTEALAGSGFLVLPLEWNEGRVSGDFQGEPTWLIPGLQVQSLRIDLRPKGNVLELGTLRFDDAPALGGE